MLRHDCLFVSKHTKYNCYLYSLQYWNTYIWKWSIDMYFAKIHDFTAGVYPNLFFFTATFKIDNNFTNIAKLHQRISVLKVNRLASSPGSHIVFMCLFSFPLFFFFLEETPIDKMKIISGYFLQWWAKQFLKTRH